MFESVGAGREPRPQRSNRSEYNGSRIRLSTEKRRGHVRSADFFRRIRDSSNVTSSQPVGSEAQNMSRTARSAVILLAVVAAFTTAILLSRGSGPAPDAIQAQTPTTPTEPPKFVIAPYLQYPTQTSITIMWETATPGTSVVEYGLTSTRLTRVEEQKSATIHEVKLAGLEPEPKYVYRVASVLAD